MQRCLDEILEAATSIKLIGRTIHELDLDQVERGTCVLMLNQCADTIFRVIEEMEEGVSNREE